MVVALPTQQRANLRQRSTQGSHEHARRQAMGAHLALSERSAGKGLRSSSVRRLSLTSSSARKRQLSCPSPPDRGNEDS